MANVIANVLNKSIPETVKIPIIIIVVINNSIVKFSIGIRFGYFPSVKVSLKY